MSKRPQTGPMTFNGIAVKYADGRPVLWEEVLEGHAYSIEPETAILRDEGAVTPEALEKIVAEHSGIAATATMTARAFALNQLGIEGYSPEGSPGPDQVFSSNLCTCGHKASGHDGGTGKCLWSDDVMACGCQTFRSRPDAEPLDAEKTTALARKFLEITHEHLKAGPAGKDRCLELLNALAFPLVLIIAGAEAIDGPAGKQEAVDFFNAAVRLSLEQGLGSQESLADLLSGKTVHAVDPSWGGR